MLELFRRPDWLKLVSAGSLRKDLIAGIIGATLVLPQGVAFAAIAGLPAEYGFYTAIITPIVAAFLGSSWHAVSGPTTAISVLVFGALSGHFTPGSAEFISAAITLALLVGVIQLLLGFARIGGLVDFVSHSVMVGFVTAAALLIAISQIRHVLGVRVQQSEALGDFFTQIWHKLPDADGHTITVASISLITAILAKKIWSSSPNYLIALTLATIASLSLSAVTGREINTIGSLDSVIPAFVLPSLDLQIVRDLSSAAIAIAIVGLLEAVSISRAIAMKSGQLVDSNREFLGQGASNFAGAFFQCYPGSASFTRSGVNYDSGAQTPLSAIFAAIFLLAILMFIAPWLAYVPISGLAGIILLVAWRLIDIKEIKHIFNTSSSESFIAVATFLAALLIHLESAIYVGVLLSLALYLRTTSRPFLGIGAPDPKTKQNMFRNAELYSLPECPQTLIVRLDGPLYFGSVEHIRRKFREFEISRAEQKHLIFIVKGGGEIDMLGADLIIEEHERRLKRGGSLHLQVKTPKTLNKLARYKVFQELTVEHIHLSKQEAIEDIIPSLNKDICANCQKRIFRECEGQPGANNNQSV